MLLIHSLKEWKEVLSKDKESLHLEMAFYLGHQKKGCYLTTLCSCCDFSVANNMSLCMSGRHVGVEV
jgi:hypothetical protein